LMCFLRRFTQPIRKCTVNSCLIKSCIEKMWLKWSTTKRSKFDEKNFP
jgi:hypothetical protein